MIATYFGTSASFLSSFGCSLDVMPGASSKKITSNQGLNTIHSIFLSLLGVLSATKPFALPT